LYSVTNMVTSVVTNMVTSVVTSKVSVTHQQPSSYIAPQSACTEEKAPRVLDGPQVEFGHESPTHQL